MRSSSRNRFAGEELAAALAAADDDRLRKADVGMSSTEGVAGKPISQDFGKVGNQGEFAMAAKDPQFRKHFESYSIGLQNFEGNAGLAQNNSSVA